MGPVRIPVLFLLTLVCVAETTRAKLVMMRWTPDASTFQTLINCASLTLIHWWRSKHEFFVWRWHPSLISHQTTIVWQLQKPNSYLSARWSTSWLEVFKLQYALSTTRNEEKWANQEFRILRRNRRRKSGSVPTYWTPLLAPETLARAKGRKTRGQPRAAWNRVCDWKLGGPATQWISQIPVGEEPVTNWAPWDAKRTAKRLLTHWLEFFSWKPWANDKTLFISLEQGGFTDSLWHATEANGDTVGKR